MDVTSIHAHEAMTIVIHSIARRDSPVVGSLSLSSLIQGHVMERGRCMPARSHMQIYSLDSSWLPPGTLCAHARSRARAMSRWALAVCGWGLGTPLCHVSNLTLFSLYKNIITKYIVWNVRVYIWRVYLVASYIISYFVATSIYDIFYT